MNEQLASVNAVNDFYDTGDEIRAEMVLIQEFADVLKLSQTDTDASQCSTETVTDTCQEQLSPDLFSSDEEDLPIASTSKHTETSQSPINASVQEKNNNLGNPGALTLARRRVLAKLARTRQIQPNLTLYGNTNQTRNDQMFSLCTMSSLDLGEKPGRSTSACGNFKLDNMAPAQGNLGYSSARFKFVTHSKQEQVMAEPDFTVSDNIKDENLVAGLARLNLLPAPDPQASDGLNAKLESTGPAQVDSLPTSSCSRPATPGCSYNQGCVASARSCSVLSRGQEPSLDAQSTVTVNPASPESTNPDEQQDTVLDNDDRSLLVNNIDIYKSIRRESLGTYELYGDAFQQVIVTGIITGKSAPRKSVTQLEVDDGTAVVNCLFDDRLCLPEHRNSFHTCLDSWKHNLPWAGTDPLFDNTFNFLREYAKRLFQETPLGGDLRLGDEVTIVGKIYDSKNEGRVIYHKHLWRKLDLANRENSDYARQQFAKPGRHF